MRTAILLLVTLLLLTGCNTTTPPQPSSAPVESASIDIKNLADDIDVQTVAAIRDNQEVVLIDVREQSEYDQGHIPGIKLIPIGEVSNRLSEIPKDKQVIVACQSGGRSSQVAKLLRQQGYTNIHNLVGGFSAWQSAGLPVEK